MRKLIGTIAIILVLFVGLFGCERYNMKPFIYNWMVDKDSKTEEVTDTIKEETDSVEHVDFKRKLSENVLR